MSFKSIWAWLTTGAKDSVEVINLNDYLPADADIMRIFDEQVREHAYRLRQFSKLPPDSKREILEYMREFLLAMDCADEHPQCPRCTWLRKLDELEASV